MHIDLAQYGVGILTNKSPEKKSDKLKKNKRDTFMRSVIF